MPFGSGPFGTWPVATGGRLAGGPAASGAGFIVRIGSVDVTPYLEANRWSVSEELNSRDTCELPLIANDGYRPQLGERVLVLFGNVRYWAGLVHDIDYTFLPGRTDWVSIRVQCVDLTAICDRITVNEVYENTTAGAILRHIVGKYLAGDGISADGVHEGPTIQKAVFARKFASACFDQIRDLTGYHWTVDQYGVLQYFPKFASMAPFEVSDANAVFLADSSRVSRTLADFRNVQYAIGGQGITDPITDFWELDGVSRTVPTSYPIVELISVTAAGLPGTLGIRGVDDKGSKEWLWNKDQNGVNQDPDFPLQPAGTRVEIRYRGRFGPVTTKLVAAEAVTARQTIEGGTGRYEYVDQDSSLDGLDVVIAKARGDLRRFGTLDAMLEFETDAVGLAVGQTVTVNLPALDLASASLLITAMETQLVAIDRRRHRITAVTGELKGTYFEFFDRFFNRGAAVTISPDDVISEVAIAQDAISLTDLVTVTTDTGHIAVCGVDDYGYAEVG